MVVISATFYSSNEEMNGKEGWLDSDCRRRRVCEVGILVLVCGRVEYEMQEKKV